MTNGDHLGPALAQVEPDDGQAVQALFREQRARLDVVRDNGIWEWLGGVPNGFGSPAAPLHAIRLRLAMVALVAIALVMAGFTRGPWLWAALGLAFACGLAAALLVGPASRKTLRFYRRAVQAPAVIVADAPYEGVPAERARCAAVLVAVRSVEPRVLRPLVSAAHRLRRMVAGAEPPPAEVATFVDEVRRGLEARRDDGSRIAVPPLFGSGDWELARVMLPIPFLPRGELSSRLLFVLLDTEQTAPGHTRIVQSELWGRGVERLSEAFPWEPTP